MTSGTNGNATSELAELRELIERLSRLVPRLVTALSAAQLEREKMPGELARQAAKFRASPTRIFIHLGDIVRWLRAAAGLTRRQLESQTCISASTIRNIEKDRHKLTAATLHKLLAHPAMAALPELAKESGLSLGLGTSRRHLVCHSVSPHVGWRKRSS